jgi:ribonuclease HI
MDQQNKQQSNYVLFFDGCSKGNPGRSGSGSVIYQDNVEVWSLGVFVGEKQTNNYAEYYGLIYGLEEATKRGIEHITVKGDSLLVIKQMRGEYQVKSENLLKLYQQAKTLEKQFEKIEFIHIYRNENKRADYLCNVGLLSTSTFEKI